MRKKKKSKVWIIALVLLAISLSPILIDQQKMLYASNKQMSAVQKKIAIENETKEELLRQKKILNTDEYAEKVAREKFGMVKSGEKVFVDVNK
jgi:cell division protein FtsB